MQAGVEQYRQIRTIVDDEHYTARAAQIGDSASLGEQCASPVSFMAQLHDAGAAFDPSLGGAQDGTLSGG